MRYVKKELSNGVRLIVTPMTGAPSVGVNVVVGTGSRHESLETNGLSHFLEHLAFKGTRSFASQKIISEKIEAVGGFLNAYTSESVTNYHAKVTPPFWTTAIEVITELALFPLLRLGDIEAERGVILEEINRKEDDPQEKVFENLGLITFADDPLGYPTLGRKEVIKKLSNKEFRKYHRCNYSPERIVVSLAGKIDTDEVFKKFESIFGPLSPSQPDSAKSEMRFASRQSEPQISLETKETEQAHLALSLRGLSLGDERRFALQLLNVILGRGMSSRLFLNIREKGLAYSVGSDFDLFPDTGALSVFAGFNTQRIKEALSAVVYELRRFKEESVNREELDKALERQKSGLLFMLEDPAAVADWYGVQEVLKGRIETEEEIVKNLSRVKISDLQELANDLFRPQNLNLAVIGPYAQSKTDKFKGLLSL